MKKWIANAIQAGLSALPADPTKKFPALPAWKDYTQRLPSQSDVEVWRRPTGVCVVCGAVSGNVEMIDFDMQGRDFAEWTKRVDPQLAATLYIETSPSGGYHVVYRCKAPIPGNMRLASEKQPADNDQAVQINGKGYRPRRDSDGQWSVLLTSIETRGEGGLFLCAPTPGYVTIQGDLLNLPVLTADQRDHLLAAARSFNQVSEIERGPAGYVSAYPGSTSFTRPGDDFNARGNFPELLQKHGWRCVAGGDNSKWCRPGKDSGTSATLKGGVFYVFTSSAPPFEPGKGYSLFGAYTLLEHHGDYHAAASSLLNLGYGTDPTAELSAVDISAITRSERPKAKLPDGIPLDLMRCPGFISEIMDHTLATAPYPNVATAFAGALALQCCLSGRQVRDRADCRTNLYILTLAHSGSGKDHPRKINARVLYECGLAGRLGERFASGEAIQDALDMEPCMLFQTDEIDGLLQSIKRGKDARHESIMGALLTLYSSANTVLPVRRRAMTIPGKKEEARTINQPHLVLLGSAVPNHFYAAMDERMMTNGFFARMLIIESPARGRGQDCDVADLPERVLETAKWWAQSSARLNQSIISNTFPQPSVVDMTPQAQDKIHEYQTEAEDRYSDAEALNDAVATTVWARVIEQARKLALCYAVSENHLAPKISESAVDWAYTLVKTQAVRMVAQASMHGAANEFDSDCLRLVRAISECGGSLTRSEALRAIRKDVQTLERVVATLRESGRLAIETEETNGRVRTSYRLVG